MMEQKVIDHRATEKKTMEKIRNVADDCMLFNNIEQDELSTILKCLNFKVRYFNKNAIINVAGESFEGVGVVVEGQVSVVKENVAGERIVFSILRPGELFGEMAAFSGIKKWPATVIAQTDCSVIYMPSDKLIGQCAASCPGHRKLITNMLGILSRKAMTLSRQLEYLSIKSMRVRIATFLLEQHKKTGQSTFMLEMNRNELADFLNVTRPSLSREMCRMRDEGILDFHRSSVQISDIEALRNAAQGHSSN
jgi:CRP-like cAMP-binding protein